MSVLAPTVVLVGTGARTPVGATAPATAAAVRAGVAGFGDHPFMVDTAGNKMVAAAAPYLSVDVTGPERLSALAVEAAKEAVVAALTGAGEKPIVIGETEKGRGVKSEAKGKGEAEAVRYSGKLA